jgi:23S rRNA (guanosine2251-2'-O)-methyltransferase
MYNDGMPITSFEIRVCEACGLRYPLVEGHSFGTRCPVCLGETRLVLSQTLDIEPGMAADQVAGRRMSYLHDEEARGKKKEARGKTWAVLLDNIRSAWNVGSILRSADGFGFNQAFLCGITPTGDNEAVAKTALGAQDSVPWSYHRDAVKLAKGLKVEGWKVYALEDDRRALEIHAAPEILTQQEVLIVGNELTGVDPELLDLCDRILYIPMRGEKRSFNVAIAFGIAAYALTAQELKSET